MGSGTPWNSTEISVEVYRPVLQILILFQTNIWNFQHPSFSDLASGSYARFANAFNNLFSIWHWKLKKKTETVRSLGAPLIPIPYYRPNGSKSKHFYNFPKHCCILIYNIDTDEIPGFFHLLKNHIFIARNEDTIFIFHVWGYWRRHGY